MTGRLTERQGVETRNRALFGKLADGKDGRLKPENNYLLTSQPLNDTMIQLKLGELQHSS